MYITLFLLTITLYCSSTGNSIAENELLKRIQNLCNSCNGTILHTQELRAFMFYCNSYIYTSPKNQSAQNQSALENSIPTIASNDLMQELEGEDLGEFPTIEEINAYRIEDIIDPELLASLSQGRRTRINQKLVAEQLRLIQMLANTQNGKMFSVDIPKAAKRSFNTAIIGKINIDLKFTAAKKQRSERKSETYLELEQAYIATAKLFLRAHDAGYPEALREAKNIVLGPEMTDIGLHKKRISAADYYSNNDLIALCKAITERKYSYDEAAHKELVYFNALRAKQDVDKLYKNRQHAKKNPLMPIYCEQTSYIAARMLLKAHDLGHEDALKSAEEIMAGKVLLEIIEYKNKLKIGNNAPEFKEIWHAIELRKRNTHTIGDGHASSSGYSSAASSSSSPAACSTSSADSLLNNDQ